MAEVWFYHLTADPPEAVLSVLLDRALAQGWRVELRGRDRGAMEALDTALWTRVADSFLPHGLAGGPQDALQPAILTVEGQAPGGPVDCVVTVDGAALSVGEVPALRRAMILFDGTADAALARARDQWREVTGAGLAAKYWAQDGGRWVMKQEKPAAQR